MTTLEASGTGISRLLTVGVVVENNPTSVVIDGVFADLLPALYRAPLALTALAVAFAQASQVESPEVDAESITSKVLFSVSQKRSVWWPPWSSWGWISPRSAGARCWRSASVSAR